METRISGVKQTVGGTEAIIKTIEGKISTDNSTSTPLTGDAVYTGTWEELTNYGMIIVTLNTDQDSAVDGLCVQFSTDGVNVDSSDEFSVSANTGKTFSFQPAARYFRVLFTNGSTPQTHFRLQTNLKPFYVKPSSHRIQDSIIDDDDAELVKAVITGEKPDGEFINFASTKNGNFRIALDEFGDTPSIDAFARLRVSNPQTLFDSKQLHDKQPLFWDEEADGAGAISIHDPIEAHTTMRILSFTGSVIRQTKQRFNYQPGKGQLMFLTFYAPTGGSNISRIGCFDGTGVDYLTPNNGIYFENNNGTLSWNIAKNGVVTESVTQANWNQDVLDGGNGEFNKSAVELDMSAAQIAIIDFEWLGVGRVRVGFVIDGIVRYCHYFNHANDNTFNTVYMSTPNLPIRYELQGANGSRLDHICSTVISEGGQQDIGVVRSVNTGTTHVDADTANTKYAIVGIKLKSAYKDISVLLNNISMINKQSDDYFWSLDFNPTVAGTFTYSDLADSSVQYATGATANTVTGGFEIVSGYVKSGSTSGDLSQNLENALTLGSAIDGTMDEIVLCCTPLTASADILGSINFRELK